MDVLAIVHGPEARAELFAPAVAAGGHRLEEWSFVWGPPPRPAESFGAVLVFGGAMHADQEHVHPWLLDELRWLAALLEQGTPVLGVCLGVQLLARAAGAPVAPLAEPEIGWHEVELTDAGAADPVLGALPRSFEALQWHRYTYELPRGAVELAQSPVCTQAFRLGETVRGVQFHPEVTRGQLARWIDDPADSPPDAEALRAETPERIEHWNELGRRLCRAFLDAAA